MMTREQLKKINKSLPTEPATEMEKQLCKWTFELMTEIYRLRDIAREAKKLIMLPDDPGIGYDPYGDLVNALRDAGEIPEDKDTAFS